MMMLTDTVWFLPGFLLGLLHFRTLRRNAALYLGGSAPKAVALHLGRMAMTAGGLLLAARAGAWPLLLATAGLLLARLLTVQPARAEEG
ncbi:ATP synthase subunit I [Roseomonas sp. E05]|uniref:N-ATPase subunit AtpR n=1 Tax=Roseomonas sp. E05 TaxID=3046310 RepID=UPI0024BBB202|nr:ATP synthase subunit I [Roseomonas sp. E05]MDJ0390513.1 ATP synthase subunit I [Roseomonas sp. E05]